MPNREQVPDRILKGLRRSLAERFKNADAAKLEEVASQVERNSRSWLDLAPQPVEAADWSPLKNDEQPDLLVTSDGLTYLVRVKPTATWQRTHKGLPATRPVSRANACILGLASLTELFPERPDRFTQRTVKPEREETDVAEAKTPQRRD